MTKEQYIRIHADMFNELSGNELLVFALIHSFSQQNKTCYMTQYKMAEWLNINRATVIRTLNNLDKKGFITVTKTDSNIIYQSTKTYNSLEFFDIFRSMPKKNLSANMLLVYAYMRKNMKATLQTVAKVCQLSLNTVSSIVKKLADMKLIIKERMRNALGRFMSVAYSFNLKAITKNATTTCDNATTTSQSCNTYNNNSYNNINYNKQTYSKKRNSFDISLKSESYEGISESDLENLLLAN